MKRILDRIKDNYLWFIIIGSLIIIRFIFIGSIPPGMQIDEVEYALSSKTFQMMGHDVSGVGFPQIFFTSNTIGNISPVPYMFLSPVWFFLDLNLTTYRLLYIVINIVTGFLLITLIQTIFKNKQIALLGGVLFFLNPWSFFHSRQGVDGAFALLFYLLGMWSILKPYSRKNILLALLFFLLGCFSYHGAKLQLVPLVLVLSYYKISTDTISRKKTLEYVVVVSAVILAIGIFFFGGALYKGSVIDSRSQELVFSNIESFAQDVNQLRTTSLASPLQHIMINKVFFATSYIIGNYFKTFDVSSLFISSEILTLHGFFYFFEAILIIIGLAHLLQKNRTIFWLLFPILAVAPISAAVSLSGFSIMNRAILLLPMLLICISYGLYAIYLYLQKYIPSKIIIIAISTVYMGSFIYFQYVYFLILPLQNIMHYETNSRALSRYLSTEQKKAKNVVIVSAIPHVLFRQILFYQPRIMQEKLLKTQHITNDSKDTITYENVRLQNTCPTSINPKTTYIIDHNIEDCKLKDYATNFILDQRDAGTDFFIVQSKSCTEYPLTRYVSPHYLSDFTIDSMPFEQFCRRWIAESDTVKPNSVTDQR